MNFWNFITDPPVTESFEIIFMLWCRNPSFSFHIHLTLASLTKRTHFEMFQLFNMISQMYCCDGLLFSMNCIVLISLGSDFTPCMPPLLLLLLFPSTYSCHMILSILLSQPPFFLCSFWHFSTEEINAWCEFIEFSRFFWILRIWEMKEMGKISRFDKVLFVAQLCDSLKQTTYFLRSCHIFITPIFFSCLMWYSIFSFVSVSVLLW